MTQKDLRTYKRRGVTRESGYHTCESTTGGECIIKHATRYTMERSSETFVFHRTSIDIMELFEKGIFMIAFGGYIYSSQKANVSVTMDFSYCGQGYSYGENWIKTIQEKDWTNIGFHAEESLGSDDVAIDATVKMTINSAPGNIVDFISFDFDAVSKDEFFDISCAKSFYQKTYMHVPYLYYLSTELPFDAYLESNQKFMQGQRVVLKSCNRCGRFLPINIDDELKTLSFSLHCKKRAPCVHSSFRAYTIQNYSELSRLDLKGLLIEEGNRVATYYGHQLECKACKKFFVNAPLNPQRNPQQFKEDGLRRRAIEVLVNNLLQHNLVHFEFEQRTKKEFSNYIWNKFDRRCFKCGKLLDFEDMALDHTMPLAYLYRLDETATCLCSSCNSQKSDHFPLDYYSPEELNKLSEKTGLSLAVLQTKRVNQTVLNLLTKNVVWFYDEFLMNDDYQKNRDGIKTSDKINDSLKRIIAGKVDLAEEYRMKTGHYPSSVTIE